MWELNTNDALSRLERTKYELKLASTLKSQIEELKLQDESWIKKQEDIDHQYKQQVKALEKWLKEYEKEKEKLV